MSDENDNIPILDLESFVFTPPGPMGWAFEVTEEDMKNAKEGVKNIIEAERILSLDSFIELSSKEYSEYDIDSKEKELEAGKSSFEETAQSERNHIEEALQPEIDEISEGVHLEINDMDEDEKLEINERVEEEIQAINEGEIEKAQPMEIETKVKIILSTTLPNEPWLANDQMSRFRHRKKEDN